MDTRLPHFQGREDHISYLRFLDNRTQYDRYHDLLGKKIAEFLKAAELYGKAKAIEKMHDEAAAIVERANKEFADREQALKVGESALKAATAKQRQALVDREHKLRDDFEAKDAAMRAREEAIVPREKDVAEREAAAERIKDAAETARLVALDAKRAADADIARVRASLPA